ncbi:MAG: HAMP domain-containing sensor histidine kinase [Halioglobus sp.]|nr:HAMP domain-containing sensor histidine kinase [Halioglobus sp.]
MREVLSSLTFRYISRYVLVLSASVFILLGAFYAYFSYTSFRDLGVAVLEELETLQLIYRGQSLAGVEQYVADRAVGPSPRRFFYLVTDGAGTRVAGDLPASTRYSDIDDGWLRFELALQDWGGAVEVDFLARQTELGDGYQATVARGYADIVERARLVFSNLFRAMLATVLLGVIGGYVSAASALRRVDKVNRDLSRIIRGDPGQRLDVEHETGFVRALAGGINQMLEQMESLMLGVRRVSDNIAHDLRTPLTRMRNNLSQLRDGQQPPDAAQLDSVIQDCDDLLASFNASLRISTLESGSRLSGGARVDLQMLLRDVVELYEPLAQDKGIDLSLACSNPAISTGEADLLFQMFANVLDNALKYTPEGGCVSVALESEGDGRHLVVFGDSGSGIPPAERKNVFRRFYRVESSRGEYPGHGLGLSLVQAIAQYHHGSVELAGNDPGLRVMIRLPASD